MKKINKETLEKAVAIHEIYEFLELGMVNSNEGLSIPTLSVEDIIEEFGDQITPEQLSKLKKYEKNKQGNS